MLVPVWVVCGIVTLAAIVWAAAALFSWVTNDLSGTAVWKHLGGIILLFVIGCSGLSYARERSIKNCVVFEEKTDAACRSEFWDQSPGEAIKDR